MPFRLDLTAWALRRRSNNVVDRWVGEHWKRVLILRDQPIEIAVAQVVEQGNILLRLNVKGRYLGSGTEEEARAAVERCLGIKKDLSRFYDLAAKDRNLDLIVKRFCGLKPPRFPTVFEAAVNGIACQQISLNAGIVLLNHLALAHGCSVKSEETRSYAFPRPEELSKLRPEHYRRLGFSRQKGLAVKELAEAVAEGQLDLQQLDALGDEEALERLCHLRGIGRWTAEYILLRGLGRFTVFPADDVGGRRGLQQWLKLAQAPNYEETKNLVARWAPYSGLIYFHLLMGRLAEEGCLDEK